MKRVILAAAAALLLTGTSLAGVVKSSKSEITFKGFGTFRLEQAETIGTGRRLASMNSEFKGKGLLGGLAAKTLLRAGQIDEIVDLPGRTIYQITPKRKEYTEQALESWAETQKKALAAGGEEKAPAEKTESEIKIVRSEFKVEDTAEAKTFGAFPCRKYRVLWTVDWENTKTGEKGTDRLETDVWTTPPTDELRKAKDEEAAYYAAYMKAIGLTAEKLNQDVLGTQWMAVLGSFDPARSGSRPGPDAAAVVREMKKIEGYPIVTDGRYFPAPRAQAAQTEEKGGGGLGGALGKLGAGLLKKKPEAAEENAPALSFYTEVLSLGLKDVDESAFRVPEGYKKKG